MCMCVHLCMRMNMFVCVCDLGILISKILAKIYSDDLRYKTNFFLRDINFDLLSNGTHFTCK